MGHGEMILAPYVPKCLQCILLEEEIYEISLYRGECV